MRGRLAFALLALAVVAVILGLGLVPSAGTIRSGLPEASFKLPKFPARATLPVNAPPPHVAGAPRSERRLRLAFDATFGGSQLDTRTWATCYVWANPVKGCSQSSQKDYVWYLPSQARVYGGALHLVASRRTTIGISPTGGRKTYDCRSGMVTSYPSFRFRYGYIQVVARLPFVNGMWPALWLAAANKQWPPEIDLVEHWGPSLTNTATYFHPWPASAGTTSLHPSTANLSVGWHTFAVLWTARQVAWYIDGKSVMVVTQGVPQLRMYFIANLAPFKSFGCGGSLLLQSVKVWTWK